MLLSYFQQTVLSHRNAAEKIYKRINQIRLKHLNHSTFTRCCDDLTLPLGGALKACSCFQHPAQADRCTNEKTDTQNKEGLLPEHAAQWGTGSKGYVVSLAPPLLSTPHQTSAGTQRHCDPTSSRTSSLTKSKNKTRRTGFKPSFGRSSKTKSRGISVIMGSNENLLWIQLDSIW